MKRSVEEEVGDDDIFLVTFNCLIQSLHIATHV